MPTVQELYRLTQNDNEFEASLGYLPRLCLKTATAPAAWHQDPVPRVDINCEESSSGFHMRYNVRISASFCDVPPRMESLKPIIGLHHTYADRRTLPSINDPKCLGRFINSHHPKRFDLFKDVISGLFPIRTLPWTWPLPIPITNEIYYRLAYLLL